MDQPNNANAADEALAAAAVEFDNNNDDAAVLPAHAVGNDQDQDDDNDDDDDADDDDQDDDNGDDEEEEEDNDDDDDDDEIFDPAESEQFCKEAMAILQQRLKFPSQLRDRSIVRFAKQFITNVKDDIHKMLTDTRVVEEGYKGLDNERDTEDEVETAIRCCPEVLTRRKEVLTRRNVRFGLYPIRCLLLMQSNGDTKLVCNNVKAVSFVPLFVRLAIEFHSFDEDKRGGLLVEDGYGNNALHALTYSSGSSFDAQHHEHVDTTFLAVLIRLRQTGFLTKDDVHQYDLVSNLCSYGACLGLGRFRFLIEWCPSALITSGNQYGELPLHWPVLCTNDGSLQEFQLIFDALLCFYPRWKGINSLFQKNSIRGLSSFEMACEKFPRKSVMETVEQTIGRYTGTTPSLNIGNALMTAAIDDTISLDGVYFLMRRQPDAMLSMLRCRYQGSTTTRTQFSSSSSSSDSSRNNRSYSLHSTRNGHANGRNKDTDDIAANRNIDNKNIDNISNNVRVLRKSTRKRKRN